MTLPPEPLRTLDDADLAGKRVLVRVDLNVPMDGDRVTDDTRIRAIVPTVTDILDRDGRVVLLAHFGRPKGAPKADMSLGQVVPALSSALGREVVFAGDCVGDPARAAINAASDQAVVLLENTRFHPGEEANDAAFAAELAEQGDVFVNDAFAAAHRAHASTEGLARLLPAVAGRCMQAELAALDGALLRPERPLAAVVGGAKISTKIDVLGNLAQKVDYLIIGGAMANTFLAARGHGVGGSLYEADMLDTAAQTISFASRSACEIVLPTDVVAAKAFAAHAEHRTAGLDVIADDEMILDIGPASIRRVNEILDTCRTLVWNGPFGAFELAPFDHGTVEIARHAAALTERGALVTVAGGGDTVAALAHAGAADRFSYVSTAGGAFLEWLEGRALPGVEVLRRSSDG